MSNVLSPEQVERIATLDTCTVANAIERFEVRLRNEGFCDSSIHCLFPELPPVAGYAVTVKVRTSNPPSEGSAYPDRTDWWNYILRIPAPRIVVIQDIDNHPGRGALVGEVHAHILRALKSVAVITNGGVRDLGALQAMRFPVFASHPVISHAYAHITEIGLPITVAGLTIRPGDLLHADRHGVQSVPPQIAAQIPDVVADNMERDRSVIALCRSSQFNLEKLRALVSQPVPNPR